MYINSFCCFAFVVFVGGGGMRDNVLAETGSGLQKHRKCGADGSIVAPMRPPYAPDNNGIMSRRLNNWVALAVVVQTFVHAVCHRLNIYLLVLL